jgi:acetoin utilization protein AcuC
MDPSANAQHRTQAADQPLVVYGESSRHYDFGSDHPLTPRRFGPGIDLLRELGAERFMEPAQATDAELRRVHEQTYIALVQMVSDYPEAAAMAGFDSRDTPPFYGMHDAAAVVAGGSIGAMDRILSGEVTHAFHPGGGLHHAHPASASGFCVYNDAALAIARARDAGYRVLYVDLDVHHGDGVEAIFWNDPHVLTVSIHESGLVLFPGTGFVEDRGGRDAPGSAVNLPLEPGTSDPTWLAVLELVVPPLAAAFQPTMLVTQHGSDSHVLDPLAHLDLTTTAMWRAAVLLDEVAHRETEGRWLATGGGGYDVYRVVPRVWGLVWLAQAHMPVPEPTPEGWRQRWAAEAARYRQSPIPAVMLDPDGTAPAEAPSIAERDLATARAGVEHTIQVLHERAGR